jgi:hypothetical protein
VLPSSPLAALVAIISGAATARSTTALQLSAAASFDPSLASRALVYAWICKAPGDGACAGLVTDAATQALRLPGSPEGLTYVFTLTVSDPATARTSAPVTWPVTVVMSTAPFVRITPLAATKASPDEKLLLNGSVASEAPATLALLWSSSESPPGGAPPW